MLRNGLMVARLKSGEEGIHGPHRARHAWTRAQEIERGQDATAAPTAPVLDCREDLQVFDRRVTSRAVVDGVSFELHAGEIVGVFGLVGSGVAELAAAIFGAWRGRVTGRFTWQVGRASTVPRMTRYVVESFSSPMIGRLAGSSKAIL